ncbi:MAG TPA: LLM class flavin-dependent oxidoreductase, partial [Actinomycetota bacterium]|nr:LLM class flavin-dependent oxidoreductase [Actinomycetota bacterium]
MHRFWRKSGEGFEGAHYRAGGTTDSAMPHQKPHPPVWVGGKGDALLRVAAAHADAWNAPVLSPDQVAERAERLRALCEAEGRPMIEVTYEGPVWIHDDADAVERRLARNRASGNPVARRYADVAIAGTPDVVAARLEEYGRAGVTHVVCHFGKTTDLSGTQLFAREVMPRFQKTESRTDTAGR